MIFRLAYASLAARSITVCMTILAIAMSVALFIGVEKVRTGARTSFADTISGTDLIVGPRTGSVQLLLYTVFRIGSATNNISWDSYELIARQPTIEWSVPISLGDSHKQFRVMATTNGFFEHYKYRSGQSLEFAKGSPFNGTFDAVIGSDVAKALGYDTGEKIIISHGLASFTEHSENPFEVVGILARSGTPVDRTVIVSLAGLEEVHSGSHVGHSDHEEVHFDEVKPEAITAALFGVKNPTRLLTLQRQINTYSGEPLLAILPGVALQELWSTLGTVETALIGVSAMVVLTALIGLMATIFSSLNERRREMAIYRAMGAGPSSILGMLVLEAVIIGTAGAVLGIVLLYLILFIAQPIIDQLYGLWLPIGWPSAQEFWVLIGVILASAIVSIVPAIRAYRLSVADGMSVRS